LEIERKCAVNFSINYSKRDNYKSTSRAIMIAPFQFETNNPAIVAAMTTRAKKQAAFN